MELSLCTLSAALWIVAFSGSPKHVSARGFSESLQLQCSRGGLEQSETVQDGDTGNITSVGYPRGYTVPVHHGDFCQVVLLGCPTCKIRFRLAEIRFPPCSRDLNETDSLVDSPCVPGCDYLIIEDANRPFSDHTRRHFLFKDQGTILTSLSREVKVTHCMSRLTSPQGKAFRVQFQVVEKWMIYRGSPSMKSSGVLMSPNFPYGYATFGDMYTFYLENTFLTGAIRIVFDDWDIGAKSTVQVYDGAVKNESCTQLERFTRPIYTSKTNRVYIKFQTGTNLYSCCKNTGFKATFYFSSGADWPDEPNADCSSTRALVGGGVIRFRGSSVSIPRHYDCLWIIKRYENGHPDGALLQLRAVHPGIGMTKHKDTRLEIHSGITSVSPLLAVYTQDNITQEVSWFSTGQGFYARLTGTFLASDKVVFIFAAIYNATNGKCPEHHFLCHNDICIDEELVCDGLDHCSDNSDESPAQPCNPSTELPDSTPCSGFRCHDATACVAAEKKCDGIPDCYDDSDENGCYKSGSQRIPWPVLQFLRWMFIPSFFLMTF